jgi:hypothetical protein
MTSTQVPQWRFFHSGGIKSALNQRVSLSKAAPKKPCLRRAQSLPNQSPRKRRSPLIDRSNNMRRLSRQVLSFTTSSGTACSPSERRYPEKRRRLNTVEEAQKEVFNRYKLPSKAVPKQSETIDYKSLEALFFDRRETSLTIEGFDDEELAGLAFLDE